MDTYLLLDDFGRIGQAWGLRDGHCREAYPLSSAQDCSPHLHLNMRTLRPFAGLRMVRTSAGLLAQALHARIGFGSKLVKTSFLNSLFTPL
jgi:hypothetical protein